MSHIVYSGHTPQEISAYRSTKDRQQQQTPAKLKIVKQDENEQVTKNVEFDRRSGDDRRTKKAACWQP